jgi:hypothetical protein
MKVLIASPGPLDVEHYEAGTGGEVCSVPYFYGSGKEGVAAVIRVMTEDGKMLKAARLVIDGSTGKMSLQDRSEPGKAAMERELQLPVNPAVTMLPRK